ncbi:hypothetical protein [Mucilaginibacter sp. CSA2-8R]|uniref:hypothetical protein n=1 Tax=Mucilaginibacter sp. CSA2-8R TaxID=3141542 RepID=UPI00315C7CF9
MKNKEASKIAFLSSECIFAVLHRNEHILKDKIEYIKINTAINCSFNNVTDSTIIKKAKFNNDWTYEIAEREIE